MELTDRDPLTQPSPRRRGEEKGEGAFVHQNTYANDNNIHTAKGGTRQVTKSTGIGSTETGLKPLWQQLIYYGPGRLA